MRAVIKTRRECSKYFTSRCQSSVSEIARRKKIFSLLYLSPLAITIYNLVKRQSKAFHSHRVDYPFLCLLQSRSENRELTIRQDSFLHQQTLRHNLVINNKVA